MNRLATNLARLMELLELSSKELSLDLQVDPSVVSRWRSGQRRLAENGVWPVRLARYFLERRPTEVRELMDAFCPLESAMDTDLEATLAKWLCRAPDGERVLLTPPPARLPRRRGMRCVEGEAEVQRILREFLEHVRTLPQPMEILFACPDGLSVFTRDSAYNLPLQTQLWSLFQRGFRLKVVLRPDYRVSDVALACGPWLAAHLRGFIQSYYYDNFCINGEEDILVCLPGHMAMYTTIGTGPAKARVLTDKKGVEEAQERFQAYLARSERRFRYRFWDAPDGFLSGIHLRPDKPVFFFQRLPQFGLQDGEGFAQTFGLSQAEQATLCRDFAPFTVTPDQQTADMFHLIDADAVDRALDQERHLCLSLSHICGRRVYLSTRKFVLLLLRMRELLKACPHFHLLCLPGSSFDRFGMELAVCGNEAAIAWLGSGQSAACRDYPNVSALQGFCATQFQKASVEFRRSAGAQLDIWLKRAKKMGLL